MMVLAARRESEGERNPRNGKGAHARRPPPAVRRANPAWAALALNGRAPVAVSRPTDASERDADRVADRVMRMPAGDGLRTLTTGAAHVPPNVVHRKCAACEAGGGSCPTCEDEAILHRKADGTAGPLPGSFAGPLGGGSPLDAQSRAFFEPRFDRSFGDVRVHSGGVANRAAR